MKFNKLVGYIRQAKDIVDTLSPDQDTATSKQNSVTGNSKVSDNMTKEQEKHFEKNQKAELSKITSINNPADAANAIKILSEQANETIKFCEAQKTQRAQIRANAEVEIHRINTFSNMIENYLDRTFDERKDLFRRHFTLVDKALTSGDRELLAMELQNITQLAAQSPFKSLTEVKNMLENNNQKELDLL